MSTTCDTCGKSFTQKSGLTRHRQKKIPCTAVQESPVPVVPLDLILDPPHEFRDASKHFHSVLTKEERMDQGIFFTPKKARTLLFDTLARLDIRPTSILEPSFGTGEFLLDAKRCYPHAQLFGVEKNEALFHSVTCPDSHLTCGDFLDWKGQADLILGNPPYFVMKSETRSNKKSAYEQCMVGRPNIYVLFLYKCLTEHLHDHGVLAFIIPTSLYNCSYYQPMRNYIQRHTTILHMETLVKPGFYETGQETMLLVLQNQKRNDDYIVVAKNGLVYLSPFYNELRELVQHTTTLSELGFGVKTGNVVWNQVKDKLVDKDGTLLIYSSNIKNYTVEIDNLHGDQRKQYVAGLDKPTLNGPVILVERGYGNSFHFHFAVVELQDFYAENHINVVYPKTPEAVQHIGRIVASFRDPRNEQFIRWYLGNGSMSATDLESMLPIFV